MPKKKSKKKRLIAQLDVLAKTAAKMRDKYICQKCGKHVQGSNAHGSHVIPVSAGMKLRWDLNNIKTLCYHDHINWWHKNPLEAAEWFKQEFPERAAYLEANRGIVKFTEQDLERMKEDLKILCEETW